MPYGNPSLPSPVPPLLPAVTLGENGPGRFPAIPRESSPYELASFWSCWWEHLAPKFDILHAKDDICVHRRTALKGALPVKEARLAGWNNAPTQVLTEARARQLLALPERWDFSRVDWQEDDAALQAFGTLERHGFEVVQEPIYKEYFVDLSAGYATYVQGLGSSTRKGIRRKLQGVAGMNPQFQWLRGADKIAGFFDAFFPLHHAYWDAKANASYFRDPREQAFIKAWATALEQSGNLFLYTYALNQQVANMGMAILVNQTACALLSINHRAWSNQFPGALGLQSLLQRLAEDGVRCVSLGAGDHSYKKQLATHARQCYSAWVPHPGSWRAKAYLAWRRRLAGRI